MRSEYVPGPPCRDDDSDPTNLDADAGLFGRYVEVLSMAAARPDVPEEFRELVCTCRNGLTTFVEELRPASRPSKGRRGSALPRAPSPLNRNATNDKT